jgi:Cft2 family RNA processing exonuclease
MTGRQRVTVRVAGSRTHAARTENSARKCNHPVPPDATYTMHGTASLMNDGPLFERLRVPRAPDRPLLRIETREGGLYLPAIDLHLDPHTSVARAFISHAHADHSATRKPDTRGSTAPELHIASRETAALLNARYGDEMGGIQALAWGESMQVGDARVWLAPAGHILGAAALVMETKDGTLVYTGDTKPGAGLTHPAAALPQCDVLVMESTFGLPIFTFPSDADNHAALVQFARETLSAGETPVILAYALGKSQEIAQLLGSNGIHVRAHGATTKLNEVYRSLGVDLPLVRPYARDDDGPPGAILVPPRERFGGMFKRNRSKGIRVAYVSGWALFDSSRERFDADLQVPLSDHASFAELDATVDACKPGRVWVTHGYSAAYSRHLRQRGIAAEPIDVAGYEA